MAIKRFVTNVNMMIEVGQKDLRLRKGWFTLWTMKLSHGDVRALIGC